MFSKLSKSVIESVKECVELFVESYHIGVQVSKEHQAKKKLKKEDPKLIGFRVDNE